MHDAVVQHWELALFGVQVSREWWQAAPSAFWSTVLHGAYFSYYFIVSVPALLFLCRGDVLAVRRFVLAVMTTFVVVLSGVHFLSRWPAPTTCFPRPAAWFIDNPAARLVYDTLAEGAPTARRSPARTWRRPWRPASPPGRAPGGSAWRCCVPTVLLTVGVVYCQMHYAVDALAGLVVGGWWRRP